MGMAGTAQHCKEKVGLKAQGISRTSLVATEGCVCEGEVCVAAARRQSPQY